MPIRGQSSRYEWKSSKYLRDNVYVSRRDGWRSCYKSSSSEEEEARDRIPSPPPFERLSPEEKLAMMPDPPICFCGKTASKSEFEWYGVVYDCHNATEQQPSSKFICGFHVHARAWDMFRKRLRQGQDLDDHDPELTTCPYFNYTYCVLFKVVNTLRKLSPPPPKCFCRLQVAMSEEFEWDEAGTRIVRKRIAFKCPHFDIDGAKPKCVWSLWAEEVPFLKPKLPPHLTTDMLRQIVRDAKASLSNGEEQIPEES